MDSEKHEPGEQLSAQLDELHRQGKLARMRLGGVHVELKRLFGLFDTAGDMEHLLVETVRATAAGERVKADTCWITAMLREGLTQEQILAIWGEKDKLSFTSTKDSPNNPHPGKNS